MRAPIALPVSVGDSAASGTLSHLTEAMGVFIDISRGKLLDVAVEDYVAIGTNTRVSMRRGKMAFTGDS